MITNLIRYATFTVLVGSVFPCAKGASGSGGSEAVKLETEDQKTLYALGLFLGRNVKSFGLSPDELAIVKAGLTDSVTNTKPQVELEKYGPLLTELARKRESSTADDAKK